MIRHCLIATTFFATATLAAAQDVVVKPSDVTETRARQIIQPAEASPFANDSQLSIGLQISGPAVLNASAYGNVKIDQATDDTGKDLKPKESGFGGGGGGGADDWTAIQDSLGLAGDDAKPVEPRKSFIINLTLSPAARAAKQVRQIKGTLQVRAGGEAKAVELGQVKAKLGQTLADPALKQAGLTLKLDRAEGGGDNAVQLEITGDAKAIRNVDFLDAAGQPLQQGWFSSGFGEKTTIQYDLRAPLTADAKMVIDLLVGQKTVDVPFDLKNIELP